MEISKLTQQLALRSLLFLAYVLHGLLGFAQTEAGKCDFKNNQFTVEVDKQAAPNQLDNFIDRYDLGDLDLKRVFRTNNLDALISMGWKIKLNNDKTLIITKPLTGSINFTNPVDNINVTNRGPSIAQRFPPTGNGVVYGYNRFKNKNAFAVKNSEVTFYLRNHLNARDVTLTGSFNDFLPDALHMKKVDSGWIAVVKLQPGKYWYKFVVDGYWMIDEDNYLRENDGLGNVNSVYYKPNYLFEYKGLPAAKKAYVTGSFNHWQKAALPMTRTATGWQLPLYLADGTHTYKYFIDNNYYTEPGKLDKLPNGLGGYNSVARLGKSHLFTLPGFITARQVILSGSFNGWQKDELLMQKIASGWQLPYTLAPGNYEYKFLVDGTWITDPNNPLKAGSNSNANSYLTIGANYTFRLKEKPNTKQVYVAGDFNDWEPTTLAMQKQGSDWLLSTYLSPGKHKYKFVVDGTWITDPANKNWEQNEFGTGNSVVWVEK